MKKEEKIKNNLLSFEAFAMVNNKVAFAASSEFNGLFEVEVATGECTFLCMFPEEKADAKRLYTKALYVDGKVYFVPAAAKNIAIFDVEKKEIRTLPIEHVNEICNEINKPFFNGGVIYEHYIYMTPCTYLGILRIDTVTNNVEYFCDWVPEEAFVFRKSPYMRKSKLYIPNTLSNLVLEFDMISCTGRIYHIGDKNNGSWSICGDEKELWIIPQKPGAIIKWIPEEGFIKEYDIYPEGFVGNGFFFTKGHVDEESIYLVPAYANMMVQMNKKTGVMSKYDTKVFDNSSVVKFMFETKTDLYMETISKEEHKYIMWSKIRGSFSEYRFIWARGKELFIQKYYESCRPVIKEKNCYNFSDFIGQLSHEKLEVQEDAVNQDVGKLIFGELIK